MNGREMGWPVDAVRCAIVGLILGVLWFAPQAIEGRSGACNALASHVGMAVERSSSVVCTAQYWAIVAQGGAR